MSHMLSSAMTLHTKMSEISEHPDSIISELLRNSNSHGSEPTLPLSFRLDEYCPSNEQAL